MFQLLRQNEIQAIVRKTSISLQSRNGIDAVGRSGFEVGHKYFSISKRESLRLSDVRLFYIRVRY